MTKSLEKAIAQAGSPHKLLWESQTPPALIPKVVPEFTNWRDEQLAWRKSAVLYDQSHHMFDLNIKGPDALKLIRKLAVNSVERFPIDRAKQFVAVNEDGYYIGDNIMFHLDEDEFQFVGVPPSINWIHYHAETGGYDLTIQRDENSLFRSGDPVLYRYEVQGPGAMKVIRDAMGAEPPQLKFFHMGHIQIAGKNVRVLRHGMAGEPGLELWGPWSEGEVVRNALLEAGRKYNLTLVGGRAYHTNALESGWIARPLPAIYTGAEMREYREWLSDSSFEAVSALGGSYYSENIEDYYMTPFDLGYGKIVKFDHDFIGRAALEKMVADGRDEKCQKVTLVWNNEDTGAAITSSMFDENVGAKFFNLPVPLYDTYHFDRVETTDGRLVGLSTWTGYTANERAMLSLAVVDHEVAEPGTEVVVVWGEDRPSSKVQVENHKQVKIRATVAPAPLHDVARTSYRHDKAVVA